MRHQHHPPPLGGRGFSPVSRCFAGARRRVPEAGMGVWGSSPCSRCSRGCLSIQRGRWNDGVGFPRRRRSRRIRNHEAKPEKSRRADPKPSLSAHGSRRPPAFPPSGSAARASSSRRSSSRIEEPGNPPGMLLEAPGSSGMSFTLGSCAASPGPARAVAVLKVINGREPPQSCESKDKAPGGGLATPSTVDGWRCLPASGRSTSRKHVSCII